jgi:hypothetical protein
MRVRGIRAMIAQNALTLLLGLAAPPVMPVAGQVAPAAGQRINGEAAGLSRLTAIAVSNEGVLAVAQDQDGQVRLFDRQGRPVARLGRMGEGPEEFRSVRPLGWVGDTLWVTDYRLFRISFFDSRGNFIRSAPLPASLAATGFPALSGAFTPRARGVRSDGTLLMNVRRRGSAIPGMPPDVRYIDEFYVVTAMDGVALRIVSRAPTDECHRRAPTSDLVLPHCPRPLSAVAGDGTRVAHLTSVAGRNGRGTYTLRIVPADAGEPIVHQREVRLRPISRSVRDTTLAILGRERSAALRALARGYQVPSHHPAVRWLEIASNGEVWVGLWGQEDATTREWHVYPVDGRSPRTVLLPVDASPHAPGYGGIWVAEKADDGTEALVFFRAP